MKFQVINNYKHNLQRSFSILLFSCFISKLPLEGRNLASIFRNWGKV